MTLIAICLAVPERMHASGIVMEIWRLKDNGVTTLTLWGYVTIRLLAVDFLWVVHCDHALIWHRYGDMAV